VVLCQEYLRLQKAWAEKLGRARELALGLRGGLDVKHTVNLSCGSGNCGRRGKKLPMRMRRYPSTKESTDVLPFRGVILPVRDAERATTAS
jgi:hypothetical protein